MPILEAPFPYFGGKAKIADRVWQALGQPDHYIEPFFGSGAVLLRRPNWRPEYTETVNDKNAFICNVWRAIQFAPEETAKWCDWPVNHADLAARRLKLIDSEGYLLENLIRDPTWCDPELAGYWIWAASCWIGGWLTDPTVRSPKRRPSVGDKGRGVHKASVRLHYDEGSIYKWFKALSHRLRQVRVVCGDWKQVCGGNWQDKAWKTVGMFFDPPYSVPDRSSGIYHCDSRQIAEEVMAWCLERGKKESYRIVIAGYEEYEPLLEHGWWMETWSTHGGYANLAGKNLSQGKLNRHRERLYFSPHCLRELTTLTLPSFEWAVTK